MAWVNRVYDFRAEGPQLEPLEFTRIVGSFWLDMIDLKTVEFKTAKVSAVHTLYFDAEESPKDEEVIVLDAESDDDVPQGDEVVARVDKDMVEGDDADDDIEMPQNHLSDISNAMLLMLIYIICSTRWIAYSCRARRTKSGWIASNNKS
ncbi:hypothetical protein Droror1_Dr00019934 [Drosera rotundifolia]